MSGIGRLPTPASAGLGSTIEDDELELLGLQLSTTAKAQKPAGIIGNFPASVSNARFATHPRKRHKQRSLMTLWSDRQLLDEIQSEGVNHLLARVQYQWDFSAFSLDRLSNGSNLPTLCTYLFKHHNLISRFRLDTLTTWKFFSLVERGYHSTNPYHNSAHAADVTQAMACFIMEPSIFKYLKPSEIMAALIAAVCHDIDHPGLNEKFLIATSSHLAGLYENSSVLENHHWKSALSILWESGFAQMMTIDDRLEMEGIIKELILATDIARQPEFLSLLRQYQDTGEMDLSLTKYRHFALQIALKCADISNPCRSWNISRLWSYRACEEFFRQGDRERELGLPVTQIMDRQNISIAKVQSGFYRFIAAPLFEEWNRMLSSPLSKQMLNNLTSNQARWDLIIQQETARSASMAESVASQISSSSSSGGGSLVGGSGSRRESLDPHVSHQRLSRSSAEGDDDSDPCASYPYMQFERGNLSTAMCSRRHSLPVQTENFVRYFNSVMAKSNAEDASKTSYPTTVQTHRHPSLVPSQSHVTGPQFIRQYSFGERRRSLRHHQFSSVDSHYSSGAMRAIAANRRRIFAGNRTPMISAVESLSSTGSSHSGGSVEKSEGSSFEQDAALTCADKGCGIRTQHHGKVSALSNRVPNFTSTDNVKNKNDACKDDSTSNFSKSDCTNQNQHRCVTFQVSASSESSEHSKDDFELNLEQGKNVDTNLQSNFNYEDYSSSSRRGSAPCNFLHNQMHTNELSFDNRNLDDNDKTQNKNHAYTQSNILGDYENETNSNRRGSLPVNLKTFNQTTSNNLINNSIDQASTMKNRNSTNREYRLNYAAKRRQMAHCQKLLDKNHSIDIGMIATSCRPPMLSRCGSLRSSSFGGIGENGNHDDEEHYAPPVNVNSTHLDNYMASMADYNLKTMTNANENFEGLSHMLMYRRGSAPIHRQSSVSPMPGMENGATFALSSDDGGRNYHFKGNLNTSFGAMTERFNKDPSSTAQPTNHKSTPSLSTLLAREHIHAVQSRIQLLQNSSGVSEYYWNASSGSKSTTVNNHGIPRNTLLSDVVNNCINNGNNRSSLLDGSISTTDNNSANIRRGSLPTDFHFYNSFGVC